MAFPSPGARAKRIAARGVRSLLLRYVRRQPDKNRLAGAERRVFILLWTAYGMGGTIRAALNLGEFLVARGYEVEVISAVRDRNAPFFGGFPAGVQVTVLDDRSDGDRPRGAAGLLRRALRSRASVLMPAADRAWRSFSLWSDVRLVRHLRGQSGFVLGTRPGINLMLARLSVPALTTIGLEQMNLNAHSCELQTAIKRLYPQLDALVVLTDSDVDAYSAHLGAGAPPLHRIPNTVRPLSGAKADLTARTVFSAGRFRDQKGFDLLIRAYAAVAARHPDWRLRLRGDGAMREQLETLIEEHRLGEVVTLEGPAQDIAADMQDASIFVLSSRFEGFPLILLEAMSKGMAVVSFDCPTGPADIIEDHRNGLLASAEDVDSLAHALLEMISDESLRRRCAADAILTAHAYTIDAIGPQWLELLQVQRRGGRSTGAPRSLGNAHARASETARIGQGR